MYRRLRELIGSELPLFAFSHAPEVVAAVCQSGGVGVLGALSLAPQELDEALTWIEDKVGDRPYGVDIVVPARVAGIDEAMPYRALVSSIPEEYWQFVEKILAENGVSPVGLDYERPVVNAVGLAVNETSNAHLEVALSHSTRLIVNALGPPPQAVVDAAHSRGVVVGGLVGSVKHVDRQLERGVDLLIAQGTEAGGHCGEIATMVLVPEVVAAAQSRVPVIAAGGIGSGRQLVAAIALGASGVWTGSMWLASTEAQGHIDESTRENLLAAKSTDTVRSRAMSGKPMRQLRTRWTEAWESDESPGCLPAPLQGIIHHSTAPRFREEVQAQPLCGSPAGQVIGSFHELRAVEDLIDALRNEAHETLGTIAEFYRTGPFRYPV